jgi:hypothetical protein
MENSELQKHLIRIENLEARVAELEKLVLYLRNPQLEKDALAAEAEAARKLGFQTQVRPMRSR